MAQGFRLAHHRWLTGVMCLLVLGCPLAASAAAAQEGTIQKARTKRLNMEQPRFSYWDEAQVRLAKDQIAAGNPYFVRHYRQLITQANAMLAFQPDPVVNKTALPPSGDKHDYLTLAPYTWPNADTPDGLPWLARDGQINPMTRGANTDFQRHADAMAALQLLNLAYFLSDDAKYGEKLRDILRIWYLDPATRVNPHIDFGQGIPGVNDGRPIGVIEWSTIRYVVTSVELVSLSGLMPADEQLAMQRWLSQYTDWLINSPIGRGEDGQPQNHGSWYDVQALSLLIHLGRLEEAHRRALDARSKRIDVQIEPDGSMPRENRRTKSVNYNSMNREALMHVARLARVVGVDLMAYQSADGRSLGQSYRHLLPWARGDQPWPFEQIVYADAQAAIAARMQPMLLTAGDVLGLDLLSPELQHKVAGTLDSVDALTFPPTIMIMGQRQGQHAQTRRYGQQGRSEQ